jgi:hypothetical protein
MKVQTVLYSINMKVTVTVGNRAQFLLLFHQTRTIYILLLEDGHPMIILVKFGQNKYCGCRDDVVYSTCIFKYKIHVFGLLSYDTRCIF